MSNERTRKSIQGSYGKNFNGVVFSNGSSEANSIQLDSARRQFDMNKNQKDMLLLNRGGYHQRHPSNPRTTNEMNSVAEINHTDHELVDDVLD